MSTLSQPLAIPDINQTLLQFIVVLHFRLVADCCKSAGLISELLEAASLAAKFNSIQFYCKIGMTERSQ